ncbi:hypothetical protein NQ314_000262 [Rhamnusium bicolor]|uniref:Uncharacterized protein n=1 Tax=Rhamnusium bicolor TaxID=1586634 RepID=A0AAV8ZWP7_9CUCU|nr:hypothetical protein NQ314_000262 [Rhamnusium bicolor]
MLSVFDFCNLTLKKDENYDSIISILNEKTVFGLTNPFDADKNIKSEVRISDLNADEGITSENQAMSETNDDEEIIELVIEDSDLHKNCNRENEEAVPTTSNTPTTAKRVYENVPEENTTWKKYRPSYLQTPLNENLRNAKSFTIKKSSDVSRRRPTTQVKAVTSSLVTQRYEQLLEKRMSIANYQKELLRKQLAQQETEHALKVELLKLEIELKKRQL